MKILIIGGNKNYSIENYYLQYLNEAGIDTSLFPAQGLFYDYYQRNLFNKIAFKSGLSRIYREINLKAKLAVDAFRPDVVWVFKGMEILPSTLQWMKSQNVKLVNYNPDNPFIFTDKGSGNANVAKSIGFYDLHLTYDKTVKERIEKQYKIMTAILPFGYKLEEELYDLCSSQDEIKKVCFIGNPDPQRAKFLSRIASAGIGIDVYGHLWQRYVHEPNICIKPAVYDADFWLTLRRYRVQLNLMRLHNPFSHNMRSFEVPAVGGIMLAPYTQDHQAFFEDGKEVTLFGSVLECIQKAEKLLEMPSSEALQMRNNARSRSISSCYSYFYRSQQAVCMIKDLIPVKSN